MWATRFKRARPIFLLLVHLACCLTVIRALSDEVDQYNPGRSHVIRRRWSWIWKYLDTIQADPAHTLLFIGTSTWHYFFDPRHFDELLKQRGEQTTTYNLSVAALVGSSMFSYVTRLGESFPPDTRFKTTFMELIPIVLSREYYVRWGMELEASIVGLFTTPQAWKRLFLTDPSGASLMLFSDLVRPFNWRLGAHWAQDHAITIRGFGIKEPMGIARAWLKPELYDMPEWRIETRGLGMWNLPRSQKVFDDTFEELHTPQNWRLCIANYVTAYSVHSSFAFDRKAIDYYVDAVRAAKRFSDRVVIVILPLTPRLQERVNRFVNVVQLKREISERTGLPILDLSNSLGLTERDFFDPMHPTLATMNRLQELLVQRVPADPSKNAPVGPASQPEASP